MKFAPLFFLAAIVVTALSSRAGDMSKPEHERIGAMILPDVHDPAQLIRNDAHLLLFASAVELWSYRLETGEDGHRSV